MPLDRRTRSGRLGRLYEDIVAPTPTLTAYILAWRIPSGTRERVPADSVRPAEDGAGPYVDRQVPIYCAERRRSE